MISERKNDYTTVVPILRESDRVTMDALALDQLREAVRADQRDKLSPSGSLCQSVAYTLGMLSLTEFLKNSCELPLQEESRVATSFMLTPEEDEDYHRFYIFDNGPGISPALLDEDRLRDKNELADYKSILGKRDAIESPKKGKQYLGHSGEGLALISKVFDKLERKKIIGSIKLGNIGSDDNPQGAVVAIESKKTDMMNAAELAEQYYNDIRAEYARRRSTNLSFLPQANSTSLFKLRLPHSPSSWSKRSTSSPLSRGEQVGDFFETKSHPSLEATARQKIEGRIEELTVNIGSYCFFSSLNPVEDAELSFLLLLQNNYRSKRNYSASIPLNKPENFTAFQLYPFIVQLETAAPVEQNCMSRTKVNT